MRQHLEPNPEEAPAERLARNSLSGELYQRYAPRLLAYLCHHLPSLHDAEDALLDVFLAALEREAHLSELAPEQQGAWLWAVARNRMVDYHHPDHPHPPRLTRAHLRLFINHDTQKCHRYIHEIGEDDFSRLNILQLEDSDSTAFLLTTPDNSVWPPLVFTLHAYHVQ